MEQELLPYQQELTNNVIKKALDLKITKDEAFAITAIEKLKDFGTVQDVNLFRFNLPWKHNSIISIDGYCYDETDCSLNLFVSDFTTDLNVNLDTDGIQRCLGKMIRFIQGCLDDSISQYSDVPQIIALSRSVRSNLLREYTDNDITRIKFFILTNKISGSRKKFVMLKSIEGITKELSYQVWSIERFFSNDMGGKEREPLVIDFKEECGLEHGLPYLKADISGKNEYESYLAIIPGGVLAKLYHRYGSVLLEQNVRAFLGGRKKINREMIKTIKTNPEKFFIYNNGISVTGNSVVTEDDENGNHYITQISDMQIINGGQTTASLYSAVFKERTRLDDIYVQMKLTVIKNDADYDEMVGNISQYSNSQNTVKAGDFFSVHPFHRKMEQLSKSTPIPSVFGSTIDSYWYYERSRGKYAQETFGSTKAETKRFQEKFPKSRVITKEELAKYYLTVLQKPHIVSKGPTACMNEFAPYADQLFSADDDHTKINREFYKNCVCYAILFRETNNMVLHAPWYTVNGYKNVIVPYTIAKLLASIPKDMSLDYQMLWNNQGLYESLAKELFQIASLAHDFFADVPNGGIVTEYAKKEEAWQSFAAIEITLSAEFMDTLLTKEMIDQKAKAARKDEKLDAKISHANQIVRLGSFYWSQMLEEGRKRHLLTSMDDDLLSMATAIGTSMKARVPSEKQFEAIWSIKQKLEDNGVVVISDFDEE